MLKLNTCDRVLLTGVCALQEAELAAVMSAADLDQNGAFCLSPRSNSALLTHAFKLCRLLTCYISARILARLVQQGCEEKF